MCRYLASVNHRLHQVLKNLNMYFFILVQHSQIHLFGCAHVQVVGIYMYTQIRTPTYSLPLPYTIAHTVYYCSRVCTHAQINVRYTTGTHVSPQARSLHKAQGPRPNRHLYIKCRCTQSIDRPGSALCMTLDAGKTIEHSIYLRN